MSEGFCKWFYIFRLTISEISDITIVQETGNFGLGESPGATAGGEYIPRHFFYDKYCNFGEFVYNNFI